MILKKKKIVNKFKITIKLFYNKFNTFILSFTRALKLNFQADKITFNYLFYLHIAQL